MASDFDEIRDRWVEGYLRAHPQESSTLGLDTHAGLLADPGETGRADELSLVLATRDRVAHGRVEGLSRVDVLDRESIRRHATFRAHALVDLDMSRRSLELSVHPHSLVGYEIAHATSAVHWRSIEARLEALPRYLAEHESNLRAGLASGWAPDRVLAEHFAKDIVPGAAEWLAKVPSFPRQLGHSLDTMLSARLARSTERAVKAMIRHGSFLANDAVPRSGDTWAIGEEEYAYRLDVFFGISSSPRQLVAEALEHLADAQRQLVEVARASAATRGETVRDLKDATRMVLALYARQPASAEALEPLYRRLFDEAASFCQEKGLFRLPHDWNVGIVLLPPGIADGAGITNWPAPLLEPGGRGYAALSTDLGLHSIPGARNLAVHEAIPGHYLQSAVWQHVLSSPLLDPGPRDLGDRQRPSLARFFATPDNEAMAQHYFGPMLNVEGFAVWSEQIMLAHGFLDPDELVCAVASNCVRAARVVTDVSLHIGTMDREQAATFLSEQSGFSIGWARSQVVRYSRIPLQAITYDLGMRAIEVLYRARQSREKEAFDPARFHADFLSLGPLPPATIAAELVPAT